MLNILWHTLYNTQYLGKPVMVCYIYKVHHLLHAVQCQLSTFPWPLSTVKSFISIFFCQQSTVLLRLYPVRYPLSNWVIYNCQVCLVFFAMFICPPIWIFFSLPLDIRSSTLGDHWVSELSLKHWVVLIPKLTEQPTSLKKTLAWLHCLMLLFLVKKMSENKVFRIITNFHVFRTNKVPFIKFLCRCVSHAYLLMLLIITGTCHINNCIKNMEYYS